MLTVGPLLFIAVLVMVGIMFMVIKNVSAKSGRYFGEQQKNKVEWFYRRNDVRSKGGLGLVHESMADFDKVNEQLFRSSYWPTAMCSPCQFLGTGKCFFV